MRQWPQAHEKGGQDLMDREQRIREWTSRVEEYRTSGLTMAAWCEAQGISIHQLKYWLNRLKRLSDSSRTNASTMGWVPVTVTSSPENQNPDPGVVIRIGQVSIEVANGFDPQLLRQVVQTLMPLC
ncbi:IS66 family insertion sequence element accessory protein TnpA [Neobacillus fumarioli]|nr:IS66 family insertion sequence element accessory protein TnpB [Neobacillus fumarioli]